MIGAGFGGLAVARHLKHAACDVVLVDTNNFHTFQPLLYQVATAGLDQPFGLEAAHHLGDGRPADVEALGDARLDDVDVILGELEDALAVLLERRVMFSNDSHGSDPNVGV